MESIRVKHIQLHVEGMHCTNCALGVRKTLEKEGFANITADFAGNEVSFDLEEGQQLEKAVDLIQALGYQATIKTDKINSEKTGLLLIEKKFWFSAVFTVPLILAMFIPLEFLHNDLFQLALTIPVVVVGFYHFGRSAFYSLRSGVANMDVLIFLGSTAAFIYSLIGTIQGLGHDYMFYETSASIITIVLLGNMMEQRSVKKTTSAIDDLVRLQKNVAKRISMEMHSGQEYVEEVDSSQVKTEEKLLVNTGDKVPVDGEIYWGHCSIDERMISGESLPVEKGVGDKLIGGTVLLAGTIKMKADAVGEDTVLSQIIAMVKRAQKDKPALQNLADKISMVFVPVVVALSLITMAFWYFGMDIGFQDSLMRGIAVLVIACPCALGLAIPTAVVVGLGRTAKSGILIKGGTTFDKLANIETIVFDKTGTLTSGKFRVKGLKGLGKSDDSIKKVIYSLEKHSSHPLALSITEQFDGIDEILFEEVEELKGLGITATDASENKYVAGSYSVAAHLTDDNSHTIYVIMNDQLIGWLDMEDEIKPDALDTIQSLKSKGIKTIMLSGDRRQRCEEVALFLGMDEVYYEKLPNEKLEVIEALARHTRVAMVGDGINDAPALAKAHIGISMSDATQIAVKSAEVVLLKGKLSLLKKAILSSRTTLRTIKENLFWAFFYNVAAIPLAMAGFLTPIVAAGAMAASDVIVVLNSLRLKKRRLR
jgi:P-type Cu+ transporter